MTCKARLSINDRNYEKSIMMKQLIEDGLALRWVLDLCAVVVPRRSPHDEGGDLNSKLKIPAQRSTGCVLQAPEVLTWCKTHAWLSWSLHCWQHSNHWDFEAAPLHPDQPGQQHILRADSGSASIAPGGPRAGPVAL